MEVNPVEKESKNSFLVLGDDSGATHAGLDSVAKIATRAGVQ
jgi:hypothetical protein